MWRNCQNNSYICKVLGQNTACPYSLMDRITDSGSVGCGSIPHGGTKYGLGCVLLGGWRSKWSKLASIFNKKTLMSGKRNQRFLFSGHAVRRLHYNQYSDHAVQVYYIFSRKLEVREVGLVFCNAHQLLPVVYDFSYEHSL